MGETQAATPRQSDGSCRSDSPFIAGSARLDCNSLSCGPGCRIEDGARVECEELHLEAGTVLEAGVRITGRRISLGRFCRIGAGSSLTVRESLQFGDRCSLGPENVWEVRRAVVGRELWTGPHVRLGGGSWAEIHSEFIAGYWLHLGMRVFVNTARPVRIGNEVGIGTSSAIYTHGAYQSALAGFPVSFAPVTIGDNCWIPGAIINPGVRIGANAVIGVGSVVTRDVPAGALAAGVPCRVLRENAFPRPLTAEERRTFFLDFFNSAAPILADFTGQDVTPAQSGLSLVLPDRTLSFQGHLLEHRPEAGDPTLFLLDERRITGPADRLTEKLRDLLRRYGIRFFADIADGRYYDWRER